MQAVNKIAQPHETHHKQHPCAHLQQHPPSPPAARVLWGWEGRRLPWLAHTPPEPERSSKHSSCHVQGAEAAADAHAVLTGVIFSIGDKVTWMVPAKWGGHVLNCTQPISGDRRSLLCACPSVSEINLCCVFPAHLKLWSETGAVPQLLLQPAGV